MDEQTKRPQLEVYLEEMEVAVAKTRQISRAYQVAKANLLLLGEGKPPTNAITMLMSIGGTPVQIETPPQQQLGPIVEAAATTLGEGVIKAWEEMFNIASRGQQFCAAAAARTQET
jgi:hypothetical protein